MIYGLTIDSIDRYLAVIKCLEHLPFRPTARVVLDPGRPLTDYLQPIQWLSKVTDIMVQVRDSYEEGKEPLSVKAFEALFLEQVAAFAPHVSIWEVGNEVNGSWLPLDTAEKVNRCLGHAHERGLKTAVTFYLEGSDPLDMVSYAQRNSIKPDLALISWYPRANGDYIPDWLGLVRALEQVTDAVGIGLGEYGAEDENGVARVSVREKRRLIERYNHLEVNHPQWIGGGFYWDFCRDMPNRQVELFKAWRDSFRVAPVALTYFDCKTAPSDLPSSLALPLDPDSHSQLGPLNSESE